MKLHLGCGQRFIPGFIHIDIVNYPHVDHVTNIDRLSFISDMSVDLIYACHVLEHFKRRDVTLVLKEWYRVLKQGGILRLSVPDFQAICAVYRNSGNILDVIGPLYGGQDSLYNIHYNVFDFKCLKNFLLNTGFTSVNLYNWRETEHANIDDYSQAYWPHMDKENGIQISCNIEAFKGSVRDI